jgi:glycosyltransferase involved in cell wall biosynthesis
MQHENVQADVCLILEGTYPYTMGGVSSWTHELITMQNHLSFSIIALVSMDAPAKLAYKLPSNVIGLKTVRLQSLPAGVPSLQKKWQEENLFARLEKPLLNLQSRADLHDLSVIIDSLAPFRGKIGRRLLLDSKSAWDLLLRMYKSTMPNTSFLDYFWSWRGLFGGLYSILLAPLPKAKSYHALCTGYAGLLLARAHLETGKPCLVTEHGIYTNERRIEIASADWLYDPHLFNLSVTKAEDDREIKDFWIDTFCNYSRLCYSACSKIVTLYEGNQEFQRMDGADPKKLMVIPNGIDYALYSAIECIKHPPTVALIGRVVSIKDIKTFIKAIAMLKSSVPDILALILGPIDEEPEYAKECFQLAEHLELGKNLMFTGKVDVTEYLPTIDVIVLTSISEAQPLVILEAGAAGIPTVATNVGACSEMVLGDTSELPNLGAGGEIVPLANPRAVADALIKLLTDPNYYNNCSRAISKRVQRYYNKDDQYKAYAELYGNLIEGKTELHIVQNTLKEVA